MMNLSGLKKSLRIPDAIVFEKSMPIINNIVIKKQNYCKLYNGNIYILYLRKNSKNKCNL